MRYPVSRNKSFAERLIHETRVQLFTSAGRKRPIPDWLPAAVVWRRTATRFLLEIKSRQPLFTATVLCKTGLTLFAHTKIIYTLAGQGGP